VTPDVLEPQHAHALRPGVVLADRFRLVRSLRGTSPFAFSYQAEDLTTGESVVVKEFFPRSLVSRAADGLSVRAHSPECERDFLRALHRYALEGATLAESTHPNLVRVRAVVDANATVYLVMNRHETQPLADYLRAAGGRVASADAGRIVQHLLSALQVLHTESIIHRDLSPRSVHVGADGSAILLEFSARRHLPLHATDLAAGFAAFEQYGMRDIGPWTDVYAVSALLYYMLTGTVPPSALDRAAGEAVV
jgi:serine/threonine protein kinase